MYKYPTLSDDAIASLPVSALAAPHAACFLWTTCPQLPVALRVLAAWGFVFKTVVFCWVKTTKTGLLCWGMGNWSRANIELVLLGTRGRLRRDAADVHQVVMAPRRAPSQKPDAVRERIVQLMGDVPRIELFARERVAGWDAWGLDVGSVHGQPEPTAMHCYNPGDTPAVHLEPRPFDASATGR